MFVELARCLHAVSFHPSLPENRATAAEETEHAGGGAAKLSWPTGVLLCFGRMADCCELVVGCQV